MKNVSLCEFCIAHGEKNLFAYLCTYNNIMRAGSLVANARRGYYYQAPSLLDVTAATDIQFNSI